MNSIDFHFHHMRRILAAVLIVLAALGMPGSALAQTEIDITGGRVDPLPIAIAPFLAGGGAEESAATISAVVTNDLGRSGYFAPLDPATFIEQITCFDQTPNLASWKQVQAKALVTGQTFMAEIDTRLADKESILSLLVLRGEWDAQTARGYVTGSGNDISRGQTDMDTTTVRVRYDGPTQKFTGNFTAAPYASFALTRVNTDGFAESGGSFPATFDAHTHTAKESRLGLLTKFVAGPATTIRVTAEWIHRFDDAGDGLSGVSQTTSGAFAVAGLAPTKDQARFGFDIDHKLSADTLLNFSVHAAGFGQAHDVAGSLSLRRAF